MSNYSTIPILLLQKNNPGNTGSWSSNANELSLKFRIPEYFSLEAGQIKKAKDKSKTTKLKQRLKRSWSNPYSVARINSITELQGSFYDEFPERN